MAHICVGCARRSSNVAVKERLKTVICVGTLASGASSGEDKRSAALGDECIAIAPVRHGVPRFEKAGRISRALAAVIRGDTNYECVEASTQQHARERAFFRKRFRRARRLIDDRACAPHQLSPQRGPGCVARVANEQEIT